MAAPILSGSRPAHNRKSVPAGTVFGKLSVIEEVEKRAGHRYFRLRCACGGTAVVCFPNLRTGHTKTCGCEKGSRRHGWAGTPTHDIWIGMRTRCLNPNDTSFRNYGGRGIFVDPRWDDFEAFLADMGERPPGMDLDRIDNNGPYAPGNCRWVSRKTNLRNTRRNCFVQVEGERMSVTEAAERLGISRGAVSAHVHAKGVSHQQAIDHFVGQPSRGRYTPRKKFVIVRGVRLCLLDATKALGLYRGAIAQRATARGVSLQDAADHLAGKSRG